MTTTQLHQIIARTAGQEETIKRFQERLTAGNVTRDENSASHYCVYFLPFNPETHEVFMVDHKKAGMWIAPGGHIDEGESPYDAVIREIGEELGVAVTLDELGDPFRLTITSIDNWKNNQTCREHLDIWFLFRTDGRAFVVDEGEFHATRWLSIGDAIQRTHDPANKEALSKLRNQL